MANENKISEISEHLRSNSRKRVLDNVKVIESENQYLSIEIDCDSYINGEITVEDIEEIFNVYLAEEYNDDLGAYELTVDYRNKKIIAKITDYLS
jgi:hypothetical protein